MIWAKNTAKDIVSGMGLALWVGSAGAACEIQQVCHFAALLEIQNMTGEERRKAEDDIKSLCDGPRVNNSSCSLKEVIDLCVERETVTEVVAECNLEGS